MRTYLPWTNRDEIEARRTADEHRHLLAARASDVSPVKNCGGHWLCICGMWTPNGMDLCRGCGEQRGVTERKVA